MALPVCPFVELRCAALDGQAAETALWGDGGGRRGRLELAAGGTLFLEDVQRLPAAVQRRLAGAIEEMLTREGPGLRPVGSCSAEQAPEPELARVLDVVRIRVPPLAERREDIPLIAERFMRELAREYARAPRRLGPDALAALRAQRWAGNVRELRNVIERLVLLGEGDVVERAELPQELGGSGRATEDLYREFPSLADGLDAFERYYIRRVLAEEGADRAAAARRLGLSEGALAARLADLGRS